MLVALERAIQKNRNKRIQSPSNVSFTRHDSHFREWNPHNEWLERMKPMRKTWLDMDATWNFVIQRRNDSMYVGLIDAIFRLCDDDHALLASKQAHHERDTLLFDIATILSEQPSLWKYREERKDIIRQLQNRNVESITAIRFMLAFYNMKALLFDETSMTYYKLYEYTYNADAEVIADKDETVIFFVDKDNNVWYSTQEQHNTPTEQVERYAKENFLWKEQVNVPYDMYDGYTVARLRELAEKNDVSLKKSMKKGDIIMTLFSKQVFPPAPKENVFEAMDKE